MTTIPALDVANALRRLHRRLDFDLRTHFTEDASAAASFWGRTVPTKALAASRLLEVSRHV